MAKSTAAVTAALIHLINQFPSKLHGIWLDSTQIHRLLVRGGMKTLREQVLRNVLRTFASKSTSLDRNRYRDIVYFKLLPGREFDYDTPKAQFEARYHANTADVTRDFLIARARVDPLTHKHIDVCRREGYVGSPPYSTTIGTSNEPSFEHKDTTNSGNVVQTDDLDPSQNDVDSQHPDKCVIDATTKRNRVQTITTCRLVCDESDNRFLSEFRQHCIQCPGDMKLTLDKKHGFNSERIYSCNACAKEIIRRSCETAIQRGKYREYEASDLNITITNALIESGISAQKGMELFSLAGIQAPTGRNFSERYEDILATYNDMLPEVLRQNRIEHNIEARKLKRYSQRLVFVSNDGSKRSVVVSPILTDGAGAQRCYNHRVTGTQHLFVVFSAITKKPLYIQIDQIYCRKCQKKITEYAKATNKKIFNVNPAEINLNHEGDCYRNSVFGPAVAEEFASRDAARYLINLDDNEAIFGIEVGSDGDTKAPNRFIETQAAIVGGAADGLAEHQPDKGHFIKTISNALFRLMQSDSTFRGTEMICTERIRAICKDVSDHIHEYKMKKDAIAENADNNTITADEVASLTNKARVEAVKGITSIVPHHCGNHDQCSDAYCLFLQCQNDVFAKYENSRRTQEDLESEISRLYATKARFNGKVLALDEKGMSIITKLIMSKIDSTNIDRVSAEFCTNPCEGFFGILTKYTEGKRRYLPKNYGCIVAVCACKLSNPFAGNDILLKLGVDPMTLVGRQKFILSKGNKKQYWSVKRRSEESKAKRIIKKQDMQDRMMKGKQSKNRHKSDKLSPKDNCSSPQRNTRQQKRKALRCCSNCNTTGHTSNDCDRPNYKRNRKKIKKSVKDTESYLELINACTTATLDRRNSQNKQPSIEHFTSLLDSIKNLV